MYYLKLCLDESHGKNSNSMIVRTFLDPEKSENAYLQKL
jgi:hypothetical protein